MTNQSTRGSALIYVLVAIALLAALTVSLMEPAGQQTQSQNSANLVSELSGQVGFITSALSECVLSHPDQDSGLTSTEQKNAPYPINPTDSYFTAQSATPGVDATNDAENIRCPGNPGGTGSNNQDHARIFGGASGKFLPPAPSIFGKWTYYNGADGVFIMIATSKTDPYIATALTKLDAKYSKCESDIIDRRASGSYDVTTEGATPFVRTCGAGELCFRYWVILKNTVTKHQDAGCP